MMSFLKRKEIPMIIILIFGIVILLDYYYPTTYIKNAAKVSYDWAIIVVAFGMGVGIINLLSVHIKNIRARVEGVWPFSIWLIFLMILYFGIGVILGINSSSLQYLYSNAYMPLYASVYSLVGFYQATATFRTLRIRNLGSAIFVVVAILMMLRNTPLGEAIWPGFQVIGMWLLDVPSAGGTRGLTIVTAIGAIILGLRVLMGQERAGGGE